VAFVFILSTIFSVRWVQNESSRYCHDVLPSVCLGWACMWLYDALVGADLSLWLKTSVFWAPWHQCMSTYSQPSFSSSTWNRGAVWICELDPKTVEDKV